MWFNSKYTPHGIVYSTTLAKNSILQNNLTPSEFLRPFFDLKNISIPIPIYISPSTKQSSIPNNNIKYIQGYKIDLYDADKYVKVPEHKRDIIIKEMLSNTEYIPNWTLYNLHLTKTNIEPIISQLQHNAFPYYDELEQLHLELSKFNESDMLQQPVINIYVCSVNDNINCIIEAERNQRPLLIKERVYEDKLTTLIILINDTHITQDKCNSLINKFKRQYEYSYTICIEMNTNVNGDSNNDIWENYIHKVDLYNEFYKFNIKHIRNDKTFKRGKYISQKEIETLRNVIKDFIINYNISKQYEYMKNTEIFLNKHKVNLISFLQKEDISLIPELNIKRLTQRERKTFTLLILHLYFQNYSHTCHIIKKRFNYEDLKERSFKYIVSLNFIYTISKYLKPSKNPNINISYPYDISIKYSTQFQTYSILIVIAKLIDYKYNYSSVRRALARSATQLTLNYIPPLLQEKSSYYHLLNIDDPNIYSFISNQLLSCIMFVNNEYNTNDIPQYTLNALGSLFKLFTSLHDNAYYHCKVFYYSNMVRYSHVLKQYETSIECCKMCIQLLMKRGYKDKTLLTEMFGMFCNSVKNYKGYNGEVVNEYVDLNVPVLRRERVIIMEEEDYEFYNKMKGNEMDNGVGEYERYSIVLSKKKYCILTKNDRRILYYLRNGILNYDKDKMTDGHKRNRFNIRKGKSVYVRFNISNPLIIPITLTSLKLIITNITPNNDNSITLNATSEVIESLTLNPNSNTDILLKCTAISNEGTFTINGFQTTLNNTINLTCNFNYAKNDLSLYTKHKTINHLNLRANYVKRNLLFQFTLVNCDKYIDISFPKGKDISVYTNELYFIPVVIINKLSEDIKKVTVYVSEMGLNKKRLCLCDYYYEDIEYDKPKMFFVPVYCDKVGMYYISLITKFEETYTYKDYEINRQLITLTCKQGHLFSMYHSISSFDYINDTFTLEFNLMSEHTHDSTLSNISIPITTIPNTSLQTSQTKVHQQTTTQYISFTSKQISLSTYTTLLITNYITKITNIIYTQSSNSSISFQSQQTLISTIIQHIISEHNYSLIIPYEYNNSHNTSSLIYSFLYYRPIISSFEINPTYIKKTLLAHLNGTASTICTLHNKNIIIELIITFHNTNVIFSTFINQIHLEINSSQCKGIFTIIGNSKYIINIHSTSNQTIHNTFNIITSTSISEYIDLNIINARIIFNDDIPLKTCLIKNIPLLLPYKL